MIAGLFLAASGIDLPPLAETLPAMIGSSTPVLALFVVGGMVATARIAEFGSQAAAAVAVGALAVLIA